MSQCWPPVGGWPIGLLVAEDLDTACKIQYRGDPAFSGKALAGSVELAYQEFHWG